MRHSEYLVFHCRIYGKYEFTSGENRSKQVYLVFTTGELAAEGITKRCSCACSLTDKIAASITSNIADSFIKYIHNRLKVSQIFKLIDIY